MHVGSFALPLTTIEFRTWAPSNSVYGVKHTLTYGVSRELVMASEIHRQQLKRHRQPESSPVDTRRRRSPAFGTRPSRETTPTYSSSSFLPLLLGLWGSRICVLADPLMLCVCLCLFFLLGLYGSLFGRPT